jgi:uncharacterized protein YndB with AHSA1/START domain
MKVAPTGHIDSDDDGKRTLLLTREFAAPIQDVWAAVTEPERLQRWIGTFTGDPASGRVSFLMTAEGEAPAQDVEIVECDPPRRLVVNLQSGERPWRLELDLAEADGGTRLTFAQPGIDPVEAESVGPGWEYYLDRLVAAETGGDVATIDFDRDYYPAMLEHYRA